MSSEDRRGSLQDDRSCQTRLSHVVESRRAGVPTINTPTGKTRKCYLRMCKKLRIPPLTRFTKQIGHAIIDMNSAALRCKDTNAICLALMRQHELDCLNFSDNALLPKSLGVIYKLMATKTHISQLDLSNNQLGGGHGSGMELVADIAADNVCLRYLDISGNNIGDADAQSVGRLIKEGACLWELKMSHNQLRENGGMQIGEAIAINDTLYVLDLSWNHLRGRGAECVALGLMKNSNLVKLDVAWNGFAFEGSVAMAYALKQNTTLTDLNMASNRIHPPALWELWKGVTENKVIRKISISHNPISAIATTPLMFMVRNKLENGLEFLDLSGVVVDKEFDGIVKEIQKTRPDFHVLYDRSLPVHKDKWAAMAKASKATYNVDPVRILFFAKKNLRIIDMFNKMDTDGDCRLTKTEVYQALKREDYSLSSQSIDAIFSYLDVDGDGYLDLSELMLGERRLKRRIIAEARVARERDKLEVERGEDGMRGDPGGFGGRFSKTYRADASQMPSFDPEHQNLTPSPNRLPKIAQSPKPSPRK